MADNTRSNHSLANELKEQAGRVSIPTILVKLNLEKTNINLHAFTILKKEFWCSQAKLTNPLPTKRKTYRCHPNHDYQPINLSIS
ncbi:hypothetical protein [Prochlorococcus sp. MIT 1306]|uniref:hypothetical protein n=1 Tax=Prochlorococcus sp. MIT 1306 TaxID=1799667 RepID=UPI0007BB29F3|nr:hypothetical protein [Prochlorococcus sp. MIT 1306]KZR61763.1 hypothetical protein PMIT1306_02551 [Prochlorococcus sp. MIT 1306]